MNRPLDSKELERTPNTHDAVSLLRPQNAVVNIQDYRQSDLPGSATTDLLHKTSTVDITGAVDDETAPSSFLRRKRPYRIHLCHRVQDAHSAGENQLLTALWRVGTPDPSTAKDPYTKRVTMGWKRMGALADMSDKAAKRNLSCLIDKLAVELISPEDSTTRTGRTYLVYSFRAILERRSNAAMLYVVRDKGVRFITKAEMAVLHVERKQVPTYAMPENKKTTVDGTSTVDKSSPGAQDKTSTDTVDIKSRDTVDKTTTPLRSLLRTKEREPTTTNVELGLIVQALSQYGVADEAAARQIVLDSQKNCKDAQGAEIVAVIHEKAPAIIRNRSITNPLGMLIRAVPKCFEGSGITELRGHWAAEKQRDEQRNLETERQRQELIQWVRSDRIKYEAILADPGSTDPDRNRATKELGQLESFREG